MIVAGILGPIEDLLAAVIDWLGPHGAIGLPWAWAIVGLTVLVRMALVPLTVKQIHSMQNLQRHAPEMKEIQRKYKGDRTKMNEELMKFYKENSINPASSCLPILFQIPIFISLFFVLRDFEDTTDYVRGDSLDWLGLINITEPASEGWGVLLLVIYVASQVASTYFMSATMERTQRLIFFALPFLFIPFIINFEAGLVLYWATTNLWTVGQGVVTRRLVPRTKVTPQKKSSRTPPKAETTQPATAQAATADEPRVAPEPATVPQTSAPAAAPAREAKEEGRPQAMTADGGFVELEASGETIGEAKWQALRELEQLHPGLDRDAVTFEVLTEGERGLLGVGTSPARVLARVESAAIREAPAPDRDASPIAGLACELVERIATALGVPARVTVAEDDESVRVSVSAPDAGVLIGRDGRTIDAMQHVVSSIAYRTQGEGGKGVEVDAGGYRERRRARLETMARQAADRANASGAAVRLEAMSALERRIVHLALEDVAGVETHSEGDDPERCVVVVPSDG